MNPTYVDAIKKFLVYVVLPIAYQALGQLVDAITNNGANPFPAGTVANTMFLPIVMAIISIVTALRLHPNGILGPSKAESERLRSSGGPGKVPLAIFLVLGSLALAQPARADKPLTICLSGCPDKAMKASLLGDTQLNDVLWLGPSVGIDMATRYSADNTWTAGVVPGVGYGLKWRPRGWTFSNNALALDLFVAAGFVTGNGASAFDMRVEPVLTFVDWISVGVGHRWVLSGTAGVPDQDGWLLSFGIRKAIDGL
jgi:hypothetical protein